MNMDTGLTKALNAQITLEFNASYIYLGMSAYFESLDLDGFSSWLRAQSAEERSHGMRIYEHLAARNAPIELEALACPKVDFNSPLAVVSAALAHEQGTTRAVNALYARSVETGDYQTKAMMDWFVNEQIEEEDTLRTLESHLKIAGNDGAALLLLDRELGMRPTTTSDAEGVDESST